MRAKVVGSRGDEGHVALERAHVVPRCAQLVLPVLQEGFEIWGLGKNKRPSCISCLTVISNSPTHDLRRAGAMSYI